MYVVFFILSLRYAEFYTFYQFLKIFWDYLNRYCFCLSFASFQNTLFGSSLFFGGFFLFQFGYFHIFGPCGPVGPPGWDSQVGSWLGQEPSGMISKVHGVGEGDPQPLKMGSEL